MPVQERAAARMAKVLSAAEQMLATLGPEKTSIPALAEAAEVPRAAIYPFFLTSTRCFRIWLRPICSN